MLWDFILRLFLAGIFGAAVGIEREYRAKEAGFRTHFLVAVGSALMMIVSKYGFDDVVDGITVRLDPSRIAGQVITGIGFIGAGTIILRKQMVRGLTTAAGIFATAGIGLAVGSGMYWLALVTTVLVLIGMEVFIFSSKGVGGSTTLITFLAPKNEYLKIVSTEILRLNCRIQSYHITEVPDSALGGNFRVEMIIRTRRPKDDDRIMRYLQSLQGLVIEHFE